jgi:Flp pilus assembly protein TadD
MSKEISMNHEKLNMPQPLTRAQVGILNAIVFAALLALTGNLIMAQSGTLTLFGDVKVDDTKANGLKPQSFDIILYTLGGNVVGRQKVSNNGRYRFLGIRNGEYDLVVEVESAEVVRLRLNVGGVPGSDFRQDIELEWRSTGLRETLRKQTISAADVYQRPEANQSLFEKAQGAVDKKKYEQAVTLFRQLLDKDAQDFQAWTELGTAYLLQGNDSEAEKAYMRAIELRPGFVLPLLNIGRLRTSKNKFQEAIEPLTQAVELQPTSAEANFLLGEAYLQTKKGSKAVGYLNEAAKLGKAEAHLRLATLYNAAGLKDRAATEYEEFLKKQPDYPDRKKLEQYISANKKPTQ